MIENNSFSEHLIRAIKFKHPQKRPSKDGLYFLCVSVRRTQNEVALQANSVVLRTAVFGNFEFRKRI